MKRALKFKRKKSAYLFVILVCVFLILKVERGFSESSVVGGFWNYIQIYFIISGFILLILKKGIRYPRSVYWLVLYSTLAMLVSIFRLDTLSVSSLFDYLTIPYGAMVFIVFYYVGTKLNIGENAKLLKITFYIVSSIVIYNMLRYHRLSSASKGAVADVYYVLGLLPLMLIYTNEKRRLLPIIITAMAILLTDKRAGIIAFVVVLIVYYIIISIKECSLQRFIKAILSSGVLIMVVYSVVRYFNEVYNLQTIQRLQRLTLDGGSGRKILWSSIWNDFLNSNLIQIIFGHGNGSVYKYIGGHAHNDFLELLYEYGIFSLSLYIIFYISLINTSLIMYKANYRYTAMFMISIIISLILASFSFYVIEPTYITCGALTWGLLLSDWEKSKIASHKVKQLS